MSFSLGNRGERGAANHSERLEGVDGRDETNVQEGEQKLSLKEIGRMKRERMKERFERGQWGERIQSMKEKIGQGADDALMITLGAAEVGGKGLVNAGKEIYHEAAPVAQGYVEVGKLAWEGIKAIGKGAGSLAESAGGFLGRMKKAGIDGFKAFAGFCDRDVKKTFDRHNERMGKVGAWAEDAKHGISNGTKEVAGSFSSWVDRRIVEPGIARQDQEREAEMKRLEEKLAEMRAKRDMREQYKECAAEQSAWQSGVEALEAEPA